MRIYSLKPFKLESDSDRQYDILRAYLISKRLQAIPNEVPNVINQRVHKVRCDTSAIQKLRQEFPVIDETSVSAFAYKYDLQFMFFYRKNSRQQMEHVFKIGNGKMVINIGLSGFEDIGQVSFTKLSLLREMDRPAEPCNYLKSKMRSFHSILDAFRYLKMLDKTDEEFFQDWGTLEIKFNQFLSFAKLFKIGIEVWTDEEQPDRLRTAYVEPKVVILISKAIQTKMLIHIHDEIKIVLDPTFLRVHHCKKCFKDFKRKQQLLIHEKACERGTIYSYKEKKYGCDTEDVRLRLVEKQILQVNEPSLYNFVSFDIESLNVPVQQSLNRNGVVRYKQEVQSCLMFYKIVY